MVCSQWKAQRKILWAEVPKESRRGKERLNTRTSLPTRYEVRR